MPETYTQVHAFCGLAGHYHQFIKMFSHHPQPLYDVLGQEVKMGPMVLPKEAQEAADILKDIIQNAPVNKSFLLEADVSKEGLEAMLCQKQDHGCYQTVVFGNCSLTSLEQNYHSSKLKFLALKWSVTKHFKKYLTYVLFTI